MAVAAPELETMVALASVVASAAAMDGSGKVAAGSATACEELASASLAEAVVVVMAAGAVAAAGAMAAVATVAVSMATFSSGTSYAAAVAVLSWDAIASAPPLFGHRKWMLGFECARGLEEQEARIENGEGGRRSSAAAI